MTELGEACPARAWGGRSSSEVAAEEVMAQVRRLYPQSAAEFCHVQACVGLAGEEAHPLPSGGAQPGSGHAVMR